MGGIRTLLINGMVMASDEAAKNGRLCRHARRKPARKTGHGHQKIGRASHGCFMLLKDPSGSHSGVFIEKWRTFQAKSAGRPSLPSTTDSLDICRFRLQHPFHLCRENGISCGFRGLQGPARRRGPWRHRQALSRVGSLRLAPGDRVRRREGAARGPRQGLGARGDPGSLTLALGGSRRGPPFTTPGIVLEGRSPLRPFLKSGIDGGVPSKRKERH